MSAFAKSLETALLNYGTVLAGLLPLFIVPMLAFLFSKYVVDFDEEDVRSSPSEVLFFSVVGVAASFVNHMSQDEFFANILPQLIAILIIVFQILGLSTEVVKTPFTKKKVLVASTGGVLSFIFATRYFEIAFGS